MLLAVNLALSLSSVWIVLYLLEARSVSEKDNWALKSAVIFSLSVGTAKRSLASTAVELVFPPPPGTKKLWLQE